MKVNDFTTSNMQQIHKIDRLTQVSKTEKPEKDNFRESHKENKYEVTQKQQKAITYTKDAKKVEPRPESKIDIYV